MDIFGQCSMKLLWIPEEFTKTLTIGAMNIDHFAAGGTPPP